MKRCHGSLPLIFLDAVSDVSLPCQIYEQLKRGLPAAVRDGLTDLPSTRAMARELGVSRNTVMAAYDRLAAEGLIRGERGSGMRVMRRPEIIEPPITGLNRAVREAHYPARICPLRDPDGNPLYLNY